MNQSAFESRIVRGMKYSSTCCGESSSQILFKDSTALEALANVFRPVYEDQAYLLSNQELFNSSQILERGQENMAIFGTPNILNKVTELFAQSSKNLIFVFHGLCGQPLAASTVRHLHVELTI